MTCPRCGRQFVLDPEMCFHPLAICSRCQEDDIEQQDPAEVALHSVFADIEGLKALVNKAAESGDLSRMWWLFGTLRAIEDHASKAVSQCLATLDQHSRQNLPLSPIVTKESSPF